MQDDVPSDDAEGKQAQTAVLRQSKSLRPSLTRSPTVRRSNSSLEKPGAAMVSQIQAMLGKEVSFPSSRGSHPTKKKTIPGQPQTSAWHVCCVWSQCSSFDNGKQ